MHGGALALQFLRRQTLHGEAGRVDLLPRRVKLNDIIFVTSQLAVMIDTGINVSTALSSIAGACADAPMASLR